MNWVDTTAKFIKELFKPKTINEIIAKELREAHLKKLEAESAVEYARSIVTYNEQRIKRLEQRLLEHTSEGRLRMTKDEIIEMARQAKLDKESADDYCPVEYWTATEDELKAFAKLVAAKEREACARIVEVEAMQYAEPVWAYEIVNDIRARGEA